MTKLTQQEIEKEREMFVKYFVYDFSENNGLDKVCSIHKVLQRDFTGRCWDESINVAFKFWLARAELAKGGE